MFPNLSSIGKGGKQINVTKLLTWSFSKIILQDQEFFFEVRLKRKNLVYISADYESIDIGWADWSMMA